jgi:hypothetical protein
MHAEPVKYKGATIIPVASLSASGYAAMAIVTSGVGKQRAFGPLGYLPTEKAACEFAVSYAKTRLDRRKRYAIRATRP